MLMVDTVQIMLPLFSTYCKQMSKTKWEIIGEVTDYGLVASSRYVKRVMVVDLDEKCVVFAFVIKNRRHYQNCSLLHVC